MKRIDTALLVVLALVGMISTSFGQVVWPPEGMNMPGSYDGFSNPPTVNAIAGIQKVGGTFLLDTLLQTRRYHTVINVAAIGGDITNGTYNWLFTSGESGNFFHNKWNDINVIIDSVQTYTHRTSGGTDNSVTVADSFYTVNFQDNGYADTKAIWMSTATAPFAFTSAFQSPAGGSVTAATPVVVTVNLDNAKPPTQNIYVRYTTDNFASSSLLLAAEQTFDQYKATIPGQLAGTQVKYYAFSTKFTNPTTDVDLKTLNYINNTGANYSYSIPAPNYTITATAGPSGSIFPSGAVVVASGGSQLFTFTPAGGYYVDSIIVDNVFKGDSGTYQFTNVTANHTITVKFAHDVNETFQVNMGVMRKKGFFRPDLGDVVTVRGTFNDFGNSTNNPDTLTDPNNDSIYTKTVSMKANTPIEYKFWKTLRATLDYENDISNRLYTTPDVFDDTIAVAYFDNQYPDVNVTFRVNMGVQQTQGRFRPDSGDVVTVRGSFNDFGNSTNNPDTLTDPNNDSIYTKTVAIPGNQTIQYKFWKTLRDGQDYEIIPPNPLQNRSATLVLLDTILPVQYYNDDNSEQFTDIDILKGWNMVSVPRTVSDSSKSVLFPPATSQAFGYNGSGYVIVSQLLNGRGYWLKFPNDTTVPVAGISRALDSIPVTPGWNMIGTLSAPITAASIVSVPPGLITSKAFSYAGHYVISDTLIPGKGYWLKTNGSGTVVLNQYASAAKQGVQSESLSSWDNVTIQDAKGRAQTLYLYGGNNPADLSIYELPPVPLGDAFDVRFLSNRFVELVQQGKTKEFPISVTGGTYPLTVTWDIHSSASQISMEIGRKDVPINGRGSVRVADASDGIRLLVSGARVTPSVYALIQNYPNPFNPTTSIQYELPEQSNVRLIIYNVLGERVAELVNDMQSAGDHSIEWNATNGAGNPVASGMYFYSIHATSSADPHRTFAQVKKMMLMR